MGLLVMGKRLVTSPAAGQSKAESVVRLGVVGLDLQGPLKMDHGLLDFSVVGQDGAEVVVDCQWSGSIFKALRN